MLVQAFSNMSHNHDMYCEQCVVFTIVCIIFDHYLLNSNNVEVVSSQSRTRHPTCQRMLQFKFKRVLGRKSSGRDSTKSDRLNALS